MNSQLKVIFSSFALSGKKKIAIIGKGQSLDKINLDKLNDFFIITINNSEKIIKGDVCLYHFSWVRDYLKENENNSSFYLTSKPLEGECFIKVPHVYEGPENDKPIQERFFGKSFSLEDATIISAIKLSNLIADFVREKLDVFLLGFDFSLAKGFSKQINGSVEFGEWDYVESQLNSQQAYLELILKHSSDLSITVNHVGTKSFSSLSPDNFNKFLGGEVKKAGASYSEIVLPNSSKSFNVKIVAEITTNHFGDLKLLKKMIKAAAESGADYIKLQKRDVETFYTKDILDTPYSSPFGSTFRDYRNGLELTEADFRLVDSWCNEFGIKWFVSVLDLSSYEFMKQFNLKIIKLPSTISEHIEFLEVVAKEFSGDVVLSTGMTDKKYEHYILQTFTNCHKLYLLQCVSSYPTMNEDANVAIVRHYHDVSKENVKIIPGYSSHDVGSLCCQLSVAAGALMVEKHVKYGNTPWAHFDNVAIDMLTDNFTKFVNDIRLAELCMGSPDKKVLDSEHHKYKK